MMTTEPIIGGPLDNPEHYAELFIDGYIECALWAENDQSDPETGGEPIDANYGPDDLSAELSEQMEADCRAFIEANAADLEIYHAGLPERAPDYAGHDFWLTRRGHGTGFWDRYYGKDQTIRDACERLTEACKAYSEEPIYVGDDGKIYGF